MMSKQNIRYYSEQASQIEAFGDWLILAGKDAYKAYFGNKSEFSPNGAGTGEQWQLIRTAYRLPLNRQPCLLDTADLPKLANLRLAPEQQRFIKIFQVGEIPTLSQTNEQGERDDFKTRILMNLAANNPHIQAVEWVDQGMTTENLTPVLERIKQGQDITAQILQETAGNRPLAESEPRTSPYVEKRTVNGLRGLYRITPKYNHETGELISEREEWLSEPAEVIGIGRNEAEDFIVLQWTPEQSQQAVIEALPLADLGEKEGWKQLRRRGLKMATSAKLKNHLADHLQLSGRRTLWSITNATGWQNGAYILPNGELIGTPTKPTLYRTQSATANGYHIAGTVDSWRAEIAGNVIGNPFMMLGVATALSAPLLHWLNADAFGVHLFGGSTAGKTTIANIASSIYGNPDHTRLGWNATALGLMNEASARNDGFMALDEIGQGASLKHVEQTAYALFNGVGKIQGAKEGGNRDLLRWRIVAFSTGELDLESYLANGGIKIHAGQLVRLLNIPITQAKQYHAFTDGKAHADHLNLAAKQHYGAIGRAWIEWLSLADNRAELTACYEETRQKWLNRLPEEASPQVQRVAGRFAVLETALLTSRHLTGWQTAECGEAMNRAFNEWVNIFGLHSREERQIIEQVNGWLLANAEGRFIRHPIEEKQTIHNIAGYRMTITDRNLEEHFYLYPLAFDEAIKGQAKDLACQILADRGMLKQGNERGYKFMHKLPHKVDPKRTRCYLLYPITETDTPPTAETETSD